MGKWNTIHWKSELRKFKWLTLTKIIYMISILV